MILDLITYGAFFLVTALSYGIICLGLNVQWGQTGLFNVGVAGFVAIGAYTSALLTTPDVVERLADLACRSGWVGSRLLSFQAWQRHLSVPSRSGFALIISQSQRSALP